MHLCPGRNFQFVFPLLHVNKLQCLLIVALHGRGRAPPTTITAPPPPQPASSVLRLVGVAGLLVWVSTSLFIKQ